MSLRRVVARRRGVRGGRRDEHDIDSVRILVGRWVCSDELGAGVEEEFFKCAQRFLTVYREFGVILSEKGVYSPSTRNFRILFAESLFCNTCDVVVEACWRQSVAHGEESIHAIRRFTDLDSDLL
jgi:hypothetical protein